MRARARADVFVQFSLAGRACSLCYCAFRSVNSLLFPGIGTLGTHQGLLEVDSKAQVRREQIPVHLSPPASAALLLHQHVCRLAIVAIRLDVSRN